MRTGRSLIWLRASTGWITMVANSLPRKNAVSSWIRPLISCLAIIGAGIWCPMRPKDQTQVSHGKHYNLPSIRTWPMYWAIWSTVLLNSVAHALTGKSQQVAPMATLKMKQRARFKRNLKATQPIWRLWNTARRHLIYAPCGWLETNICNAPNHGKSLKKTQRPPVRPSAMRLI